MKSRFRCYRRRDCLSYLKSRSGNTSQFLENRDLASLESVYKFLNIILRGEKIVKEEEEEGNKIVKEEGKTVVEKMEAMMRKIGSC